MRLCTGQGLGRSAIPQCSVAWPFQGTRLVTAWSQKPHAHARPAYCSIISGRSLHALRERLRRSADLLVSEVAAISPLYLRRADADVLVDGGDGPSDDA